MLLHFMTPAHCRVECDTRFPFFSFCSRRCFYADLALLALPYASTSSAGRIMVRLCTWLHLILVAAILAKARAATSQHAELREHLANTLGVSEHWFVDPDDGIAKSILNNLSALTGEDWSEEIISSHEQDLHYTDSTVLDKVIKGLYRSVPLHSHISL